MAWLGKFNPKARLRGEQDVTALIFLQFFIPKIETHITQRSFIVESDFSTKELAKEALEELSVKVLLPIADHVSAVQRFNNRRNAEIVSFGISQEIDQLIRSISVLTSSELNCDFIKLSDALDDYVLRVGLNAIKAAQSGYIDMSPDQISRQLESVYEAMSSHRKIMRSWNPIHIHSDERLPKIKQEPMPNLQHNQISKNAVAEHRSIDFPNTNKVVHKVSQEHVICERPDQVKSTDDQPFSKVTTKYDSQTSLDRIMEAPQGLLQIACPKCIAVYSVPIQAILQRGAVQCSNCNWSWTVYLNNQSSHQVGTDTES